MEKKKFIKPSVGMIKLETSAMICGSGTSSITTPISSSVGIGGSTAGPAPTSTTQGGTTGIFGDARNGGAGINVAALDF